MSQNPYYQDPQYQPSYTQQPQGPYGQPYQPGAYTPVPEKKPEPSTVVKTGIYLIFGYALYTLVSSIYNSVTLRDRMNALLEQQKNQYSPYGNYSSVNFSDSLITTSIVVGILIAVIIVALTVVIGYFYAKGHTWARITALVLSSIGTAFGVIALIMILTGAGTGSVSYSPYSTMNDPVSIGMTIFSTVLQGAIIVFMVLRDATQYTAQSRIWRMYQQNQSGVNPYQQQGNQPYNH